jgi:hypothetical protein
MSKEDKKKYDELRKEKRHLKVKEYFGKDCQICGKHLTFKSSGTAIHHIYGESLDTKHRAYEHPEDWEKCILICGKCHYLIHRLSEYSEEDRNKIIEFVKNLL